MPMRIRKQSRPSFITPQWKFCPKCGARNKAYRKFCKVCATKFDDLEPIGDNKK